LSYVLSIALVNKNRHLITAGCAEVILALIKTHSKSSFDTLCESIARTPTCELDAAEEKTSSTKTKKYTFEAVEDEDKPKKLLSDVIIEWAAVKIPLKFLHRYYELHYGKPTSLPRDSHSACAQLQEELMYAHKTCLLAVSRMVALSLNVALYVSDLPGALDLLKQSFNMQKPLTPELAEAQRECITLLRQIKIQKNQLSDHHENSRPNTTSSSASMRRTNSSSQLMNVSKSLNALPSQKVVPETNKANDEGLISVQDQLAAQQEEEKRRRGRALVARDPADDKRIFDSLDAIDYNTKKSRS